MGRLILRKVPAMEACGPGVGLQHPSKKPHTLALPLTLALERLRETESGARWSAILVKSETPRFQGETQFQKNWVDSS